MKARRRPFSPPPFRGEVGRGVDPVQTGRERRSSAKAFSNVG